MNRANRLMKEIHQLENELELLMLRNCSLSDLEEVINLQETIHNKNIKYYEIIENGCF